MGGTHRKKKAKILPTPSQVKVQRSQWTSHRSMMIPQRSCERDERSKHKSQQVKGPKVTVQRSHPKGKGQSGKAFSGVRGQSSQSRVRMGGHFSGVRGQSSQPKVKGHSGKVKGHKGKLTTSRSKVATKYNRPQWKGANQSSKVTDAKILSRV
ncbi:ATP-binding cassette sub-family B member 8, mitochondrial [Platysternon megacephalum]|uniref:ATP-binding cassette sub-family B member 8, mitochondrial n=1 Tax=Platysternon megacephalum TaxID=55544 RepID=A0A4D9DLZ0_9SAUR|nr:ATP-binding cassette sub-family B member 8, mitochondrial [Platysternon megacephalum]